VNVAAGISRVLILGKGGRLAKSLIQKIQSSGEQQELVNLSTRSMGSCEFDSTIKSFQLDEKESGHTIFWCSGSSSNRSPFTDCQADEKSLRDFIKIYSKKVQTPPHLIYFSSGGSVYGKSPGTVNELSPLNPQTHYAEMKANSEEFLLHSAKEGRVRLTIFRLANLYGGYGLNGRQSLVEVALTQKEIYLSVNPKSTKQYGTFDDYAQYVLDFIKRFGPKIGHPIVKNLYSESSYSIEDILELTSIHNPFLYSRRVYPPTDYSLFENVTLTSADQVTNINYGWATLESYLER
jgi:hypothetical protein